GQAQARAVREARLEGFKKLLELLSREPDTCVGQGYPDVACAARFVAIPAALLESRSERSSLGHGLQGIVADVPEDLAQLVRIDGRHDGVGRALSFNPTAG